jgi:hypothetical protein
MTPPHAAGTTSTGELGVVDPWKVNAGGASRRVRVIHAGYRGAIMVWLCSAAF